MPGIIVAQDSNTVTQVGNVIIIEGGGLTPAQSAKLDNVPSDTNTELAAKVDKITGKGLSTNDYTTTDYNKVQNLPSNTNTSLAAKADLVGGKIPVAQIPDSITGGVVYQGTWNATTNTPSLIDGTGTNGHYYKVSVAGSQDLGSGSISFAVGDWVIYNGTTWDKIDQSEIVTSVNGQTGAVSITVPTDLSELNQDANNRTVTDTEKGTWNAKPDTGDIPTSLSELAEDTTHRVVTDTEKATWNGKAEPGDYAAAISITGTHTETTTAIDFSSVQGKSITLTANRTFTVSTGLSASNPVGVLKITHGGFTPTFSDVDNLLDSPSNKSGVYYLKFTRESDGTITQSNRNGGGASTLEELNGVTATTSELNKLTTLLAGFKAGTPSIATLLSGSDITVTITPGTEDSRFSTTLYNIYRSTNGTDYTLYDTEATTEYVDSGLTNGTYYYKVTTVNDIIESDFSNVDSETVINWEFEYDFVTATYSGSPNNLPEGWVQLIGTQNGSTELIEKVTDQGMRFLCTADMGIGHYNNPPGVEINTDYEVQIDIDTFTSGAIYILGLTTPSPAISTSGTHTYTVNTGSWNRILIRRSGSGSDCIISAIRWRPV